MSLRRITVRNKELAAERKPTLADFGRTDSVATEIAKGYAARDGGGECHDIRTKVSRVSRGSGPAKNYEAGEDFYPLSAPGMPPPGPDFLRMAAAMGEDAESESNDVVSTLYAEALRSSGSLYLPVEVRAGNQRPMAIVTGHLWGSEVVAGPVNANVMVVGKMLGDAEVFAGRNMVGPSGRQMTELLDELQVDWPSWYVTNIMKIQHPTASEGKTNLPKKMLANWLPLLHQELRIVRPRFVLCMGADAIKAILGPKMTLKKMRGRVVEHDVPAGRKEGDDTIHRMLVMACVHPAAVVRDPSLIEELRGSLSLFTRLTQGDRPDREEEGLDHRVIRTRAELEALADEIKQTCEKNRVAIDAEWDQDHPQDDNAYIVTVQVSWGFKKAACVVLHDEKGEWCFDADMEYVAKTFNSICRGKQVAGHFFNADLEWLEHFGFDIEKYFRVRKDWQTTRAAQKGELRSKSGAKLKPHGGFDTAAAVHAVDESADFSLTACALRYTSAPRYDVALQQEVDRYCHQNKITKGKIDGYGFVPHDILIPYANYDADVTWRMVDSLMSQLDCDRYNNCCWEPFWTTMYAMPAALEITRTGILVDRQRMDSLVDAYMSARVKLIADIQRAAKWPDLNLNSVYQVREFLFGEAYNGKQTNPDEPPIRLRPPGAISLRLKPLYTTGKRPRPWSEVEADGEERLHSPSTDKANLGMLARENQEVVRYNKKRGEYVQYDLSKYVVMIQHCRFVSQVLRSFLRVPATGDDDQFVESADGHYVYEEGMPGAICSDGRVRTFVSLMKETGRWSTSRPALQNCSKTREKEYKLILGENYKHPLRSVLVAPPGYKLVESDYIGAEVFGAAVQSQDQKLIEHCRRSNLPDNHPDYYDNHSNVAVMAFNLNCPATKKGLDSIGKLNLRHVAKSVLFGLFYGRGAKAIALEAKQLGIPLSVDGAQSVIDTILKTYAGLEPFFAECRRRSQKPGWLCNAFGRFRRFRETKERSTIGEQEREAMNFPIQSFVADPVAIAAGDFVRYREKHRPDLDYRVALQIHDALLFQVKNEHVAEFVTDIIPDRMVNRIPVLPCRLDGTPIEVPEPYYFGIETDIYQSWGEPLDNEQLAEEGIILPSSS